MSSETRPSILEVLGITLASCALVGCQSHTQGTNRSLMTASTGNSASRWDRDIRTANINPSPDNATTALGITGIADALLAENIVKTTSPPDSWGLIAKHLEWSLQYHNRRVDAEKKRWLNNKALLETRLKNGSDHLFYVFTEAEHKNLPAALALLPFVESFYDPHAYSPVGAAGMWQFMPTTGRAMGLKQTPWEDQRRHPTLSTEAALRYLARLNKEMKGDWALTLAAYNYGPGNVRKAIRKAGTRDYWHLDLPAETQHYVPRLIALAQIVAKPEQYGLKLPDAPPRPAHRVVSLPGQYDLTRISELTGITITDLYALNPHLNQAQSSPYGPHNLLLPANAPVSIAQLLIQADSSELLRFSNHSVSRGESLGSISNRYGVSVQRLKKANDLTDDRIYPGQVIKVPGQHQNNAQHLYATLDKLQSRYRQPGRRIASAATGPQNRQKAGQMSSLPADTPRKLSYKVQRGDSLTAIAKRYNLGTTQIKQWNSIADASHIQAGQQLTLFLQ
jgi:membrane-bound lytic murein transglycosylase D